MSDILVIGSLNADLVVRAPRFPKPGETISGEDLQIIAGGKGANQAVAAARLGMQVAMMGKVGEDRFGSFLLDGLNDNNVDAQHVGRAAGASGTAIIVVDSNGQNSIVLSAGANAHVYARDVDALKLQARMMLLQLEIPLETVSRAAQWGKDNDMIVILNPAPVRALPSELIKTVDYLVLNETELTMLTTHTVNDVAGARRAARVLLQRGAHNVIVTLGEQGAVAVGGTIDTHVKTFPVTVVDTTAAGDAFIGGFAAALLQNESVQDAVRFACACGALAVTKFGAQPSLPTRDEVDEFLSSRAGA